MRTNHLFSLICLFLLSGSVIGQSFSSSTSFPVSVPDGAVGTNTCFGTPTAASATVNVTGLNGVVGNAGEITANFSLNAPANSAGDFVVTLVSPNGISVNLLSRIGGCNSTSAWSGSTVVSIQNGGITFPTTPTTATPGQPYRPSSGITAASGNTYATANNGMTAFQGGPRNGMWTLEVRDMKLNALTATITSFSLDFNRGISFDPATVPSLLCPGADYAITANSVGPVGSFAATTDFVIELSDATGSFTTPTEIGRVSNVTSINGPITAHIPGSITPGTAYDIRIRTLQSAPNIIGNSAAVDINGIPSSAITPSASLALVGGTGPEYEFCQTVAGASAASLDVATCVGCVYEWTSFPVSTGGVGDDSSTFEIGDIATLAAGTVHTVIVTNPASTCKDTTSFEAVIRKDMPATPTIASSSASVCAGLIDLIASVSPSVLAGTYEWFDSTGTSVYPGMPGTVTADTYPSVAAGDYRVVVTDPNSTCSSDTSAATTVNAAATLVLQPFGYHIDPATPLDSFIFCSNSTYNVNVTGGGSAAVYTWSANGSVITTGSSYVPPVSATYTVTTTDANGCPATISVPMQVRIAPSPAPTVSASGTCGGATLSASAAPLGNTLNWYVNDTSTNPSATGQVYITPRDVSGNYTVRLTAPNTCYAESFPVAVTAAPDTAVVAAVGGNCLDGVNPVKIAATPVTPGQTYQWYMNAVVMPGETSDTLYTYFAGDYTVVVLDGVCESAISNAVTVNEAPSAPTLSSSSTCQGALMMTTLSPGLTYQWYLDGVAVMAATADTLTAAASGAYTIEVTNTSACTTASTDTLHISPAPIAPIVINSGLYCVDATHPVTLYATGATGTQTYQWYIDGTPTGNGNDTLDVTTAATITVSIKDGSCESASIPAAITYLVAATPTIAVASNCVGTLLSSSTSPSGDYQWYLDGVAIPGATSQTHIATVAGSYTVTVFNFNFLASCESDPSAAHLIIPAPAAPSIIDPSTTLAIYTACMGTSGTALFATGATGTQTYKWFYNGSPIVNATSSPYTATVSGNYYVVVNDGSCSSDTSNHVTVYPAPGMPTITGTTGCIGATLTSSAAPAGGSYEWYLDGNPVGGNTQSITAAAAGEYTVVVSSASPANCPSPASAGKVILGSIGTATIVASGNNLAGPFSFCSGAGGTLTSGLTGTGYTYTWSVGANVLSYGSTITPTSSGTYILNVANANGCSASISQAVTMAQPPVAPSLTVGSPNCAGTLLTSSLGSTYKWYRDISGTFTQIVGASSQTYTAATPGTYRVTITNVNGCGNTSVSRTTTASSGSVSVTISTSKFTGSAGTTPSFSYCSADKDTLKAIVVGTGNTYQWKKNNVNIAGANTAKYVPNTNGAGTYSVVVGASATCTATASQAVTMTASPAAPTITAQSATAICSGSSVTLNGSSPIGVTTFLWIRNSSNYVSVAGNGLATGTYTATSAATTAAGTDVYTLRTEIVGNTTCRSAESAPVSVKRMNPVPSFNNCAGTALGTAATLCKGATLSALSTGTSPLGGTYTYSWYFGTTLKGTASTYNITAGGNHRLIIKETIGAVTCSKGSANTNITLAATGCTPVTCRLASDKDNADELIDASFEAVENGSLS